MCFLSIFSLRKHQLFNYKHLHVRKMALLVNLKHVIYVYMCIYYANCMYTYIAYAYSLKSKVLR